MSTIAEDDAVSVLDLSMAHFNVPSRTLAGAAANFGSWVVTSPYVPTACNCVSSYYATNRMDETPRDPTKESNGAAVNDTTNDDAT